MFFEQGTGKTWISGAVADTLFYQNVTAPHNFSALFIVPLANIDTTWATFFRLHTPWATVCRTLEQYRESTGPRILLLHYEALPKVIKKISKVLQWALIVVDESQRIKNRSTLQSRTVAKLKDAALYKIILSGTPMEEGPVDLWAQFRFLRPEVFGTRWKDFENSFLEPLEAFDYKKYRRGTMQYARMFKKYLIDKNNRSFDDTKLDILLDLIAPYSLRVTKEDVLELPSLTFVEEVVILSGEQRRVYNEMKRDMVAQLTRGRMVSAPLRITQIGKLHQVCGGHTFDDDGDIYEVGRAKIRRVHRLVNRHKGELIVIFCRYVEELLTMQRELMDHMKVGVLMGEVKKKQRAPLIEAFQRGELDVLICQIKTGGVGIDLFKSHIAVFYSTTYSFIDFEQAISRVHRRGQENEVTVYLITAQGTIDEVIHSAIRSKRKVTGRVLVDLSGELQWRKKPQPQPSPRMALTPSQKTSASSRRQSVLHSARQTSRSQAKVTSGPQPRRMMKS